MKKLIMFIFLLLSLATMIMFSFSINELFTTLGFGSFDLDEILSLFQNSPFEDIIPILGVVLWGVFQLYGIPLIVFLVSLHGLTSNK